MIPDPKYMTWASFNHSLRVDYPNIEFVHESRWRTVANQFNIDGNIRNQISPEYLNGWRNWAHAIAGDVG